MNEFKLSDEVIGNIAKLVQIAILTGTDIVDNMRTIRLSDAGDGNLVLEENFKANFDTNIKGMLEAAENSQKES